MYWCWVGGGYCVSIFSTAMLRIFLGGDGETSDFCFKNHEKTKGYTAPKPLLPTNSLIKGALGDKDG